MTRSIATDPPPRRTAPDHEALRALAEEALRAELHWPMDKVRTLAAGAIELLPRRKGRRNGAKPLAPTSPDGQLLVAACAALGRPRGKPFNRGELAVAMGIGLANRSMLCPAKLARYPLRPDQRAQLQRWIQAGPGET